MQVPILCMRHGEGDTIHSVYESLICNELLEVPPPPPPPRPMTTLPRMSCFVSIAGIQCCMVSEKCSCDQPEGITGISSQKSTWVRGAWHILGVSEVQEMQPEPSLWPPTSALGRDGVWDKARGRVIIAAFGGALPRRLSRSSPRGSGTCILHCMLCPLNAFLSGFCMFADDFRCVNRC